MTQSRTWQKKLIADMAAAGHLDQLRWYVEMDVPAQHRRTSSHRIQVANYPPGFVPTIRGDIDGAEEYAHLLLEVFKATNPGRIFRTAITPVDLLDHHGYQHYEWGDDTSQITVDTICTACGLVGPGRPGATLGCSRGCLS